MADLAPKPYGDPQWLISGRDFQIHAFHHAGNGQVLEALCTHSVPPDMANDPRNTVLAPMFCGDCLRAFGGNDASHVQKWLD